MPVLPDPLLLPIATTAQAPLTAAYAVLNVPGLPAGGHYLDPATGAKVYKLTSATFPPGGLSWIHSYSEGGDEVSLPHTGETRTIHVYATNGTHRLIDFTPGVGVSNPRELTGNSWPWSDLAFAFSNNPATPQYAYIVTNTGWIGRVDFRGATMVPAPGDGWPIPGGEIGATWLHQSENDGLFVWMRGTAKGSPIVGYEPSTGTKKLHSHPDVDEPRIDRGGRYIGLTLIPASGLAGLEVWDWLTDTVVWAKPHPPPFAHVGSCRRRWYGVHWDLAHPLEFCRWIPDVPNSHATIGGPTVGRLIYGNGNWIQKPADLRDQWCLFHAYGVGASFVPANGSTRWLAPGGMVFVTERGDRRLLGHPYNTATGYNFNTFAKCSPDGRYVLFTSDMMGSGRSDLFLAEVPVRTVSPPEPPEPPSPPPAPPRRYTLQVVDDQGTVVGKVPLT